MKLSSFRSLITATICGVLLCSATSSAGRKMSAQLNAPSAAATALPVADSEPLVQLAVLLDTSGSMKGLADQARCQIWNAVSRLATAKRGGLPIRLQIAVYQFGTESVSKSEGCLRQVIPFTEDLDVISEALFRLQVAGGDEYCGAAINAAAADLEWSSDPSVYKTIVIAGNESFFQGETTFGEVLPQLASNSIVLNSIYCGTKYREEDGWQAATEIARGRFARIDHNHHLPNIKTPYDEKMRELNREMNATFVWYGKHSHVAADNQKHQDENTARMSDHAFAARMSAKIGHLYHHVDHDLVDAMTHGKVQVDRMPTELMPENLRRMTADQRVEFLNGKISDRQSVRRRMADLIAKRHAYLQKQMMNDLGKDAPQVFGEALIEALVEQATDCGFEFDEKVVSVK